MNYIRHLNAFFARIKNEDSLTPFHISLYLALFQYWNFNRFRNPFPVYRDNIMKLAKIGSKETYHKGIKLLHNKGYIIYHPAPSKYIPVTISVIPLDKKRLNPDFKQLEIFTKDDSLPGPYVPESALVGTNSGTRQVPDPGHIIKQENIEKTYIQDIYTNNDQDVSKIENNKTSQGRFPTLAEVETFFLKENMPAADGQKFYYYNESKNWMLHDSPIRQWKALARNWIMNVKEKTQMPATSIDHLQQEIQSVYEFFLDGKAVVKYIKPGFFDHLQLELSEDIMKEAILRRINQLTGSNEYSHSILLQHYTAGNWESAIIQKDSDNLTNMAHRLAVIHYFESLKNEGQSFVNNQNQSSHGKTGS